LKNDAFIANYMLGSKQKFIIMSHMPIMDLTALISPRRNRIRRLFKQVNSQISDFQSYCRKRFVQFKIHFSVIFCEEASMANKILLLKKITIFQ
jgi:hypothetical protein